ncbi:MAG: LPS assembly protein LptD [Pseudomonadota bacterium]
MNAPARAAEASCPQVPLLPVPPELAGAGDSSTVKLSADQAEVQDSGWSRLRGAVRLLQGERLLAAEQLDYDKATRRVTLQKPSTYQDRNVSIRSRSAQFDLGTATGSFIGTEFALTESGGRGEAQRLALTGAGTVEADGASYTTCARDSEFWKLRASHIEIDQKEGIGVATHARIEFAGVPLLYTPYLRFPTDRRRRSGLLAPTLGDSVQTGFDFAQPIYLNLSENYDATLTPRYMSARGIQLGASARYLFENSAGDVAVEYLPEDRELQTSRGLIEINHRALLASDLAFEGRYAEVSDPNYFEDLATRLESSSTTYLDRHLLVSYVLPASFSLTALVQDYQSVAANIAGTDEPYRRLPQVRFSALTQNSIFDVRAGLNIEYAFFERQQVVGGQPRQAQRVDFDPYLRLQKDRDSWYVLSQLDFRGTLYQLPDPAPGVQEYPSRALPQFSTEAGLRFERLTGAHNVQTLEPKLFYLYVPYRNQENLPVLDSGVPDFDFVQLFARNNFTGEDRIGDANHVALSVTTRLLEPDSGVVRLNASIGQIYRLAKTRVPPPCARAPCITPDEGPTDFIAAGDYQISERWSLGANLQWSPDDGLFKRNSYTARYRDGGWRADLSYRFRERLLEQTDLAVRMPLPFTDHWSFTGRWRYSLPDGTTQEALAGLGYDACCWGVQVLARRYLVNTQGEFTNGVYLQLELKGLANLGSKTKNLLPEY